MQFGTRLRGTSRPCASGSEPGCDDVAHVGEPVGHGVGDALGVPDLLGGNGGVRDVDGALIETHGAVSEPVARAMAQGALSRS